MLRIATVTALLCAMLVAASTAPASNAGKGKLFLNGEVVGTVVPPSAFPNEGTDPFYAVTNGAAGQLGIAGIGPGEPGYRGGHWAVYLVTFNAGVMPYLLTSDEAVASAHMSGDVSVTRAPSRDFLCPVTA